MANSKTPSILEAVRMALHKASASDHLTRRGWLLWGVTFSVVIALTASIPLLYVPLLHLAGAQGALGEEIKESYTFIIGLAGLIVVFCLYTALKQAELNRMRAALLNEEQDKEAVRSRLSELSSLFQVSTTLNLQLPLDAILEIIVRRVVSTLKAQQASIMVYDAETGVLETRASYGLESEFARNARTKMGEGIAGWVAQRNEAVLLAERATNEDLGRHYKRDRNITSALSLPIRVGERCIGVMNVNRINYPVTFQEHHRDLLLMFSEHVGAVVDRAQTMERLGSRTRQLEADNQRLNEINRLKDVFLSTATHELKTPLTSVIGYSELLGENARRLSDEQRDEFVRRLRSEAERLLGLIEDILDLSRIECGKIALNRTRVSVVEMARAAVQTSRLTARKYEVEIEELFENELPDLALDEVKMRQVVVNLLVNAIKFSPAKGLVTLRVSKDETDVLIEVIDRGPGIAPEETTYIFELFGQGVNAMDETHGGLGIGLHLVKRLSELHGGHVGVNSRPGAGSTFWVRLPLVLADLPTGDPTAQGSEEEAAA